MIGKAGFISYVYDEGPYLATLPTAAIEHRLHDATISLHCASTANEAEYVNKGALTAGRTRVDEVRRVQAHVMR